MGNANLCHVTKFLRLILVSIWSLRSLRKKVQLSQPSYGNHFPAIAATTIAEIGKSAIPGIVVATIAGEWFPYDRWTFFPSAIAAITAIIWKTGLYCSLLLSCPFQGKPAYKFGFRSSVQKNGLPGEGRHEGLVPRNDVLTTGFIRFSLARTPARIMFGPRLRTPPPPRNPEGVANQEG